ncbi:MAG TPA: hypothetical protein VHT52_23945 [Stellaceae bacterium]|jgi:hypothetical protein|nr:hypothetical protein [Stellaceae bacterium]
MDYNETIKQIPMPARVAKLPISEQGYPVPWFVPWVDGKPATQAADPRKIKVAISANRCWVCGEQLGVYKAFVIGPMCAVNRITSEPPQHKECAEYTVKACPFLTKPRMKRNPVDDDRKQNPAGVFIERNPGVSLIWITKDYRRFTPRGGGVLLSVGTPLEVSWWREGRTATRTEILESMDSGLPILLQAARDEEATGIEGSVAAIEEAYQRALALVPVA